jgi:iron complex outermembrane receptor protein
MRNNRQHVKRSRCHRWISVAILSCAIAFCGLCAETHAGALIASDTAALTDSLPIYHLGEIITVRGKRDVPVSSTTEITSTSMKTQGTTTISSALSGAPGVIVTAGAKGESRLQVRGFLPQQTLVLYDGRPLALPYYGDLDLTVIPLSNVSKISVIKGPAPTLYGANSMGGVVNIVSQRVVGRPIRQARLTGAENATYDVLLNYGASSRQFDWWFSAGRSSSDGYELSDDFVKQDLEDGALRYNSDYRSFNVDGKLNYTLTKGTVVSLSAGVYDAVRGLPSGTDRARYQRYPLWRRWYTDLGSDGWWGTQVYWKAKLYYDDCENRLQRYSDSVLTDENLDFDSYHDSYALGGVLNTTVKINDAVQNASNVNVRRDVIKRQGDLGEPWVDNNATLLSISDQFEYVITPGVRAQVGAGYSLMTSTPNETSTDALDLYCGATYAPRTWLDLHLAVSRANRFPTLSQLYSGTSGNPDLRPERAIKTEIGYRARITSGLTLDQTYFLNDVTNLIDRKDRDSRYENLEKVDLSGLETGVNYECQRWQANVGYTYLHAREFNVEGETTTEAWRSHSPRHKIDYSVHWKSAFGLGIGHSGQAIMDRVGPNKEEMKNYFLAHVKATYQATKELELFVSVRNLFDVNYEEEMYYPMPGRLISAGIEATF